MFPSAFLPLPQLLWPSPMMKSNTASLTTMVSQQLNNRVCQKFHSCTDIAVGFDPSTYTVTEGDPTVDLVVFGTLDRSVFVTLTLQDGTATGKESKTCR